MKRVIITGPTGAIGIALIYKLIQQKVHVTAVCHKNSKRTARIPASKYVDVIYCDLEEISKLPEYTSGIYDTFFHFAWACTIGDTRNDIGAQIENIRYTVDAVEAAKKMGCSQFIGAGSQAEYGRCTTPLTPVTPTWPENGYGIAKLCAGQLSRIRCKQLNMKHIWTRILSVYGPYDGENTLVMSLIRAFLHGEKPHCTKGEQVWDYIYSKDAANAFFLLGEYGKDGCVYCIGSGQPHKLSEYIYQIRDCIDTQCSVGMGDVPYSDKQVMCLTADISDLVRDTGYQTEYSFQKGILETIKWCKENDNEKSKYNDSLL